MKQEVFLSAHGGDSPSPDILSQPESQIWTAKEDILSAKKVILYPHSTRIISVIYLQDSLPPPDLPGNLEISIRSRVAQPGVTDCQLTTPINRLETISPQEKQGNLMIKNSGGRPIIVPKDFGLASLYQSRGAMLTGQELYQALFETRDLHIEIGGSFGEDWFLTTADRGFINALPSPDRHSTLLATLTGIGLRLSPEMFTVPNSEEPIDLSLIDDQYDGDYRRFLDENVLVKTEFDPDLSEFLVIASLSTVAIPEGLMGWISPGVLINRTLSAVHAKSARLTTGSNWPIRFEIIVEPSKLRKTPSSDFTKAPEIIAYIVFFKA